MGYYSQFTITQPKNPVEDAESLFEKLEEISGYRFDPDDGFGDDSYKWYEYRKDMLKLSSLYPETVFKVRREGESAGDVEETYYKAGKLVHIETLDRTLPQPDLSKF